MKKVFKTLAIVLAVAAVAALGYVGVNHFRNVEPVEVATEDTTTVVRDTVAVETVDSLNVDTLKTVEK